MRVARLIKGLGSSSYAERRWADAQLPKIGVEGRREIERATQSNDPEIRLRARALLKKLKVAELWTASPVKYTAADAPALIEASKAIDEGRPLEVDAILEQLLYRTFKKRIL